MRPMPGQSLIWGACLIAGLVVPVKSSNAANCALFARAETGVALYGAAGGWWDEADGRYQRGHQPVVGAILVFKRTRQIPSGHVAVVAGIVGAHEILVDQANWYRGTVSRGMSVIDTSRDRDWTTVAVINPPSGTHGSDYPTYGFVYPESGPSGIIETRASGARDHDVAEESSRASLLQFAVATEDWQGGGGWPATIRRDHQPKEAAPHRVRTTSPAGKHNHAAARSKAQAPVRKSHAGSTRPTAHPVRTAEAKHHRA
jgi:surface antigen